MDRSNLSTKSSEASGIPDTDFIDVLEAFEDSDLLEPHHDSELKELFRSRNRFDGEVIYYAISGEDEVLATFTFLYSEEEWKGNADSYREQVDINSDLLDMIFSKQGFQETMDDIVTPFMVIVAKDRALELEVPAENKIENEVPSVPDVEYRELEIDTTVSVAVDIAKYFHSLIDEQKIKEELREQVVVSEE